MSAHRESQLADLPPWRDALPVHPAADVFPLMPAQELQELADDIEANGLQVAPVTWTDPATGQRYLLDGRNRMDAMALLGNQWDETIEYRLQEVGDGALDPAPFIIALNIKRRHLTAEQRGQLAVRAIEAGAKFNSERPISADRSVGGRGGGSTKGLAGKVAEAAGISHNTAVKAIRGEHGEPDSAVSDEDGAGYALHVARSDAFKQAQKELKRIGPTPNLSERIAEQRKKVVSEADVALTLALIWRAGNEWLRGDADEFMGVHAAPNDAPA